LFFFGGGEVHERLNPAADRRDPGLADSRSPR